MVEQISPPGSATPPHVHRNEGEWFYVLDGTLTVLLADGERRLGPGEFCFGPRGVPHGLRVDGPDPARVLIGSEPGGFAAFALRAGRPAEAPTTPPPPDAAEIARVVELAPEYGIELLGPPGAPVPR